MVGTTHGKIWLDFDGNKNVVYAPQNITKQSHSTIKMMNIYICVLASCRRSDCCGIKNYKWEKDIVRKKTKSNYINI